jgi:hypothetical protein
MAGAIASSALRPLLPKASSKDLQLAIVSSTTPGDVARIEKRGTKDKFSNEA